MKEHPSVVKRRIVAIAGAKAAWSFWPEIYGSKVRRWPVVRGKDPADARKKGLDVRSWVSAGMLDARI